MAIALDGNNPGGMNDGAWAKRQPGYRGPNGRYAAFTTLTDGMNAMVSLLKLYIRQGNDTPREIALRWAPKDDGNNPKSYAARLAKKLGITVDTPIATADAVALALKQAEVENGTFPARWKAEQARLAAIDAKAGKAGKA